MQIFKKTRGKFKKGQLMDNVKLCQKSKVKMIKRSAKKGKEMESKYSKEMQKEMIKDLQLKRPNRSYYEKYVQKKKM